MKKLSSFVVVAVLAGFLAGCYSTACQQPQPMMQSAPMKDMKGEG